MFLHPYEYEMLEIMLDRPPPADEPDESHPPRHENRVWLAWARAWMARATTVATPKRMQESEAEAWLGTDTPDRNRDAAS